jgi:hypothetical protein
MGRGGAAWRGLAVGRGFGLIRDLHNPVFFQFFFFFSRFARYA